MTYLNWSVAASLAFVAWIALMAWWSAHSDKKRAQLSFSNLRGEPVVFTKYLDRSGAFLAEMVRLEEERIRLKREALTPEEREAASKFLGFLLGNLPVPPPQKYYDRCWEQFHTNKAFAEKALKTSMVTGGPIPLADTRTVVEMGYVDADGKVIVSHFPAKKTRP